MNKTLKTILIVVGSFIGLILLISIMVAVFSPSGNDKNKSSFQDSSNLNSNANSSSTNTLVDSSQQESWNYSLDTDQMTSKLEYYASNTALNNLQFNFPYNQGETDEYLNIRERNGKTDAWLNVSQGQFNTGVDGENVKIRFDNGAPQTFGCSESSDGDTKFLFFNSPGDLIAKIKKAKKIIIEAEFFEGGNQEMTFDVSGLEWDH